MNKNKKKTNIILIATLTILLVVIVVYGGNIIKDRENFIQASKQSETIINSISKAGKSETQQYCIYNNMKYSKGVLSCYVTVTKITGIFPRSQITNALQQSKWIFRGNNDIALNDSENTYTTANLYNNGTLSCFVREKKLDDKHSKLEVGCSGPAKAEWFPVRKD